MNNTSIASFITATCLAPLMAAGVVTFADLDGMADNAPLPSATYSVGLPTNVTATWSGWLLHTANNGTPMSVFPSSDLAGDDATIHFSEPVNIASISVKDTSHGSTFSLTGYRGGVLIWSYTGVDDNVWHVVTDGADLAIDTLVAEGRWNHIDDIEVVLPIPVEQGPMTVGITDMNPSTGEMELSWLGQVGYRTRLQSASNLSTNDWRNESEQIIGIDVTNAVSFLPPPGSARFFRLMSDIIPADEVNAETGIARNGLPTPPAGFAWETWDAYTDEFDGTTLDTSKWQYDHPYWNGREPSQYLTENVSVADGKLRIKNSVEKDPSSVNDPAYDNWVGAGCVTSRNRTALYGYYEAKVRAANICMTSAFWFQGRYSEIDVVEQMGLSYNQPQKAWWMAMNTHYYPDGWANDQNTPVHWTMPTTAQEEYHVYGVWWKDANTIWMYHNGIKVAEISPGGAFDEPMYLFFDTEVFRWEGLPTVANLNDDTRNTMYVDWVRGWRLVPE